MTFPEQRKGDLVIDPSSVTISWVLPDAANGILENFNSYVPHCYSSCIIKQGSSFQPVEPDSDILPNPEVHHYQNLCFFPAQLALHKLRPSHFMGLSIYMSLPVSFEDNN